MKSLLDADAREEVKRRMASIPPDRAPKWGKFTTGKMLAHLNASLAMGFGDLAVAPKRTPSANPLGRWLLIYVLPWPQGTPTAPELLATPPGEWEADLATFRALVDRFATRSERDAWPRHPAFGKMSGRQWGHLSYRHTHHHLTQFGA